MAEVVGVLDSAQVASIQGARADMVRSVLAADWERFAQLYDEQTVVMPPNLPPSTNGRRFKPLERVPEDFGFSTHPYRDRRPHRSRL
jgi:hypothetical protein